MKHSSVLRQRFANDPVALRLSKLRRKSPLAVALGFLIGFALWIAAILLGGYGLLLAARWLHS